MSSCDDRSASDEAVWADDSGAVPPPPEGTPLTIGNVARMFNISRLALRNYEMRGLIRRHRVGRIRVYGWADCERIAFIIKGHRVGLTLREMTPLIKAADAEAAAESIKDGRAKSLELIDRLDRRRRHLREALAELRHLHTLLSDKLAGQDNPADRD